MLYSYYSRDLVHVFVGTSLSTRTLNYIEICENRIYQNINQLIDIFEKLIKLVNSQNVNCWSRCEFIRLRIQYGAEISTEIEYHSTATFQDTFQILESVFF